ncbi:MAG: metallopeptidase family protein [Patescibacteria group bacterium]|nr:metallopeptidase family protein [Patescibacteria group bacterium]
MPIDQFEQIVAEEFPLAIPEKFQSLIRNVGVLVERELSQEVRKEEGLGEHETLLGLYHGIPATARGDVYGVGATLPDTIILYQAPIEEEAWHLAHGKAELFVQSVRKVVRETIWHEVAHHFGFSEAQVRRREQGRGDHS